MDRFSDMDRGADSALLFAVDLHRVNAVAGTHTGLSCRAFVSLRAGQNARVNGQAACRMKTGTSAEPRSGIITKYYYSPPINGTNNTGPRSSRVISPLVLRKRRRC